MIDLLSLHPDVELVGAFADTASAWPVITAGNIDGAFLDIEILTEGKQAGLDLALRINKLSLPTTWIAFTSALPEKSVLTGRKIGYIGYLEKPLNENQVAQILNKARKLG
ncbi:MAG: response regulator [Methyloglobulus sp.]|nr:response regulator [Methyloglobulus sp.]